MRTTVLAVLALVVSAVGLVTGSTQTLAEILRCEVTNKTWLGIDFRVRLDITLPNGTEYDDSVLTLTDRKGKFRGIVMFPDEVGLGKIEVRKGLSVAPLSIPTQYTLLVTARPVTIDANEHYPLVAVFFEGGRTPRFLIGGVSLSLEGDKIGDQGLARRFIEHEVRHRRGFLPLARIFQPAVQEFRRFAKTDIA